MPTLAELQREEVWRRERVPSTLTQLRERVMQHFQWGPSRIGSLGDYRHLKGYHRSREWIQGSQYCTNRAYSVTETSGNRTGGQDHYVCGMDIVTNEVHARAIYTRIRTARAAGKLPQLREVKLESGPWHVHIGFDRGMVEQHHDLLYQLITNTANQGVKMVTVSATMPELREDSTGAEVRTWQTLLTLRGFPVKVDGIFGSATRGSTVALQDRHGAEHKDGIVGEETWVIGLAGQDQE